MNKEVKIVVSISEWNQLDELSMLTDAIDLVEVRADLIDIALVKGYTNKPLIYSLRSTEEGGSFKGSFEERKKLLLNAAKDYDYIELEGERDLVPELLNNIPEEKRRITWHGSSKNYSSLHEKLTKYLQTPASLYKIVVHTNRHEDAVFTTCLLNAFSSDSIVAYAVGPMVKWTHVITPFLGAPEVPATIRSNTSSTYYFTPDQLIEHYGLPSVYPISQVFGIVGNPISTSISPKLHNEAYRILGLPYLYLPFYAEDFQNFRNSIMENKNFPITLSGLTVVSPFKKNAYKASKSTGNNDDTIAKACNGLVREKNEWKGFSTDALGAIETLNRVDNWKEKRIVIVGCGGTGQTIAVALKKLGITTTLVNRTIENGERIATSLELPFISLDKFQACFFDIIIHTTPLGKNSGEIPFDITQINSDSFVIDHVCPIGEKTELVKYCELCNIKVIGGRDIARIQIKQQFKCITGIDSPNNEKIKHKLKIN
ncbi:MAG: hypothetical protein COA88_15540 [Kordia sp.]|nr:MAG: hypothetical protein COA88_15540 [Kordia sp.]